MTPDELRLVERSVVGECVFRPSTVRLATTVITGGDFYDTRLGAVFDVIVGMVGAYGPDGVNPASVAQEIDRRRLAGGALREARVHYPTLGELADLATSTITGLIVTHCQVIRDAAVKRDLAALGRRAIQETESGEDAAMLAARMVEAAKEIRDGHRATQLGARVLREVLEDDTGDAYHWIVPGLLEARDRLIITGAEGLGKSTLLRQIAVCAAAGVHPFTGRAVEPRRVLYVDCENSERQWRRKAHALVTSARLLGPADPADAVHLACVRRLDITAAGDLGAVHALVDEHDPELLIIGPLYRLTPKAVNSDDDAAPLLAALDSLRDRGPALLMEAHAGHAVGKGGERDYRPRGSAALLGWPEFGFGLSPDADDPGRANVIRWRGDRDERDWPHALRRGGRLPWTDDATVPSQDEQRRYVTRYGRAV